MKTSAKKIGLALGGGGAKGLAHIPMLEVLDELGIRPHRIAGTSIGAIMGALYASGLTGAEIRDGVRRMVATKKEPFREALKNKRGLKWASLLDFEFGSHGLLKGNRFMELLCGFMGARTFEELEIPLRIVATDFWKSEQVILESGDLLPAIRASMGLPGVFTPMEIGGRTLIDGGGVNPLPHDVLDDCDFVIAIDVMGRLDGTSSPNLVRAVLGMFDIMQNSIIEQKRRLTPPDVYIKPDVSGVDILEINKAETVYRQSEAAQQELRNALSRAGVLE